MSTLDEGTIGEESPSSSSSSSSTTTASSIAGGLALIVLAGVLNGSWNASFSPQVGCAVGRRRQRQRVTQEAATATMTPAAAFNSTTTTTTTTRNHGNGSSSSATGATGAAAAASGQEGYGQGQEPDCCYEGQSSRNKKQKKAEVVVVVMKVDLEFHFAWLLFQLYAALVNIPLCMYWTGGPERTSWIIDQTSAKSIALVCTFSLLWGLGSVGFGLACKIAGLGLGTNLTMGVITIAGTLLPLILQNLVATAFGAVILAGLVVCSIGLYFSMSSLQIRDDDERTAAAAAAAANMLLQAETASKREFATTVEAGTKEEEDANYVIPEHHHEKDDSSEQQQDDGASYSTLSKILLCVMSGLFASMLQFAFVFGEPMMQLAASNDGPNAPTTTTGTASIVWLFAFTISCPVSIVYALVASPKNIPFSTIWKCPWYRHLLLFLTSTLPWIAHIHLYGIANHPTLFLPPRLAASVSWPVLMMTTVATGMIWSCIGLGEWKQASVSAKRQLTISLCTIATGIVILMTSLAVAE